MMSARCRPVASKAALGQRSAYSNTGYIRSRLCQSGAATVLCCTHIHRPHIQRTYDIHTFKSVLIWCSSPITEVLHCSHCRYLPRPINNLFYGLHPVKWGFSLLAEDHGTSKNCKYCKRCFTAVLVLISPHCVSMSMKSFLVCSTQSALSSIQHSATVHWPVCVSTAVG